MSTKSKKTQEEVTEEPVTQETPETTAEAPAETSEEAPAPSKRDTFRGRVSQRYPDLNMDDEDAYYDQMGSMMDEYEGYENNTKRMRSHMEKSPAMAEMLLAAREQEDFDPVVWMVQQKGLDLQSAMEDPDYAEKLAAAHNDYMAKQAKGKELKDQMETNLPNSLEAVQTALEDAGLGDRFEDVVGQLFQFADDITHGNLDPNLAVTLAKGGNYDEDVESAREEGQAEGLNTKVDDKLRTLNNSQERVSGVQTPPKEKEPEKKRNNMFLA